MNPKTYQTLEFHKILKQLATFTQNEKVADRILALEPETRIQAVKQLQQETTEATGILLRCGMPPGFLITDVSGGVLRTERGGTMSMAEFLHLSFALQTARRLKSYIAEDKASEETSVRALSERIENLKQVEDAINDKIISEEEMADGASPALLAIRRKIKTQSAKVRDTLNSVISSTKFQKILQESIITMRPFCCSGESRI